MKTEEIYVLADAIRVAYLKHGNDSWVSIAKEVKEHFNASEQNAQLRNSLDITLDNLKFITEQATQLRKENERLEKSNMYLTQMRDDLKALCADKNEEITRLTELLRRAKDYIFLGYVGATELNDEIENAIGDPSGPHAMGKGH